MVEWSPSRTLLAYNRQYLDVSSWRCHHDLHTQCWSEVLFHLPSLLRTFVGLNIQISWETTVVPRPRTKRAALIAIANFVSSVSHWFTPYFFLRSQEPRYQIGGGAIIVGCGLTIVSCLVARWWCLRKNKGLDRQAEISGEDSGWRYAT